MKIGDIIRTEVDGVMTDCVIEKIKGEEATVAYSKFVAKIDMGTDVYVWNKYRFEKLPPSNH